MTATPRILGLVTARGGSKGVPRKNLRQVGGRSLIDWTVAAAKASRRLTRLVISTDDSEIAAEAERCGCEVPFMRPAALAGDEASSIDVAIHALDQLPGFDWLVLLQPTSPLRRAEDIDACVDACLAAGAPAAISVCEVEHHPFLMFSMGEEGRLRALMDRGGRLRRQDFPPAYRVNGAVFMARIDWFRRSRAFLTDETLGHVMPVERSLEIDTPHELRLIDLLLSAGPGGGE